MSLRDNLARFQKQQERCQTTLSKYSARQAPAKASTSQNTHSTMRKETPPIAPLANMGISTPAGKFSENTEKLQLINNIRRAPVGAQMKKVIELLEKTRQAFTADEINKACYVDMNTNKEVFDSLTKNVKVKYDGLRFSYKSKYEIKDKDNLFQTIERYQEGIAIFDLKDSYLDVMKDLQGASGITGGGRRAMSPVEGEVWANREVQEGLFGGEKRVDWLVEMKSSLIAYKMRWRSGVGSVWAVEGWYFRNSRYLMFLKVFCFRDMSPYPYPYPCLSPLRTGSSCLKISKFESEVSGIWIPGHTLKAEGKIWLLSNFDSKEDIAYPNDPRLSSFKVDDDLKQLFRGIDLPQDFLDIEKDLRQKGLTPATDTARRKAAAQVQGVSSKSKTPKKKEITKRTKLTNAHLPELFEKLKPGR
ncbi:hypothetical protein KSS87_022974 [Heliosperma pusillum]|nr:hypothetical protein KSS87_018222 [Heliosperma pusillum]KAH9624089.1 hypothetical protein KSS87_022974 [Heliosperma pusillum]